MKSMIFLLFLSGPVLAQSNSRSKSETFNYLEQLWQRDQGFEIAEGKPGYEPACFGAQFQCIGAKKKRSATGKGWGPKYSVYENTLNEALERVEDYPYKWKITRTKSEEKAADFMVKMSKINRAGSW